MVRVHVLFGNWESGFESWSPFFFADNGVSCCKRLESALHCFGGWLVACSHHPALDLNFFSPWLSGLIVFTDGRVLWFKRFGSALCFGGVSSHQSALDLWFTLFSVGLIWKVITKMMECSKSAFWWLVLNCSGLDLWFTLLSLFSLSLVWKVITKWWSVPMKDCFGGWFWGKFTLFWPWSLFCVQFHFFFFFFFLWGLQLVCESDSALQMP